MNKKQDSRHINSNKKPAISHNPLGFKQQGNNSYAKRYRNKQQVSKNEQLSYQLQMNKKQQAKYPILQLKNNSQGQQNSQDKRLDYKALNQQIQRQIKQAILQKTNKSQILTVQFKQSQQYNDLSQMQQIVFKEQQNQQQLLYEQFLQMERHYNEQLVQLKQSIGIVQSECYRQKMKVTIAEKELKQKKQMLRELRKQYETSVRQSAECQYDNSDQVYAIQQKLRKIKQQHSLQTKQIRAQLIQLESQNEELSRQISNLDELIKEEGGVISNQEYQNKVKQLDQQEQSLRSEIIRLEQQSIKLRADIQKMQSIKPLNTALHQKYLELYEKVILHKQIIKAQKIIQTKQSQRSLQEAVAMKNKEIEVKKQQLKQKQQQLQEKNQVIDQLSLQIRDKSTMLLNIYQDNQKI